MAELSIFCFLIGAVLGQRFRVFVLLPVTLAMALIALAIGLVVHLSFLDGLKAFILCALAAQAGYVFGSLARFWLAAARAARIFARPLKTAR
ncbi:hypothetical protein [Bradyrhizobium liaoningense]|uniref:hypothetical protein n=1 Tax=Bradyrhizobium liaoningense TaxID=43992 RepID=UPI001BA932B9|nr:hypothetical protein [Bradyrhizobium liaoningense]MBR0715878.1 hypothetical protein [Bradyrhizobium liaoningense]